MQLKTKARNSHARNRHHRRYVTGEIAAGIAVTAAGGITVRYDAARPLSTLSCRSWWIASAGARAGVVQERALGAGPGPSWYLADLEFEVLTIP
jgi:hypothetical protein